MFSEHTAPIGTYDIPIDSDFHGDGPCQIWAPGIDRVFSSITIKVNPLTFGINSSEHSEPICKVDIPIASLRPVDCCMLFRIIISVPEIAWLGPLVTITIKVNPLTFGC